MMLLLLLLLLLSDNNHDYDDDEDEDDDDAINTLRLKTIWPTFYGHFETQLPEIKCQKDWQINTEMERPFMELIWRHRERHWT